MRLRIILPFRLPTWNQLIAMNQWERKRVRDWIKGAVSMSIQKPRGWQIQTDEVVRLSLTAWSKQEYLSMIVPSASKKYGRRKKLEKMKLW